MPRDLGWLLDDGRFCDVTATWALRPRLDREAATRGVSPRVLALRVIDAASQRLERPRRSRAQDRRTRSARGGRRA